MGLHFTAAIFRVLDAPSLPLPFSLSYSEGENGYERQCWLVLHVGTPPLSLSTAGTQSGRDRGAGAQNQFLGARVH